MNEQQQITIIEWQIQTIGDIITRLTSQQTELAHDIAELQKMKADLSRLLPVQKRIDNLF